MQVPLEGPNLIRMVYSPMSKQSLDCVRQANGNPLSGFRLMDGFSPIPACGATCLNAGRGAPRNVAIQRSPIFGVKEAQSIGMTRGFPLLTSDFSSFVHRACFAALFVLIASAAVAPSAHAQTASGWNSRGQAAELKEDYDTAYEDYLKAHNKAPKDMRYQTRLDRMRFQAAAQHVDRGRLLRQSGDLMRRAQPVHPRPADRSWQRVGQSGNSDHQETGRSRRIQ